MRQGVDLIQCSATLHFHPTRTEGDSIPRWASILAIISLTASVPGFIGVAAGAVSIAEVLFFISVVLSVLFLVLGVAVFKAVDQRSQPSRKRGPCFARGFGMWPAFAKTGTAPGPTAPPEYVSWSATVRNFIMLFFVSHCVRNRIDDINDRVYRAVDSTSDATGRARYVARPAAEDAQGLLRSFEDAIYILTDEGSVEADRTSRTPHACADQLCRIANECAHQARERMDWVLDCTEETITAVPFKSTGVAVAIRAAIELAAAPASGSS